MVFSLSIVIPSHNRPDMLRACLASVLRHAPDHTEVIVVDDGSTAGTVSRAAATFVGVRTLRWARRRGFCAAANEGARSTSGAVVEFLNDDTEVTAGWAAAALRRFEDPGVGAVAPLVLSAVRGAEDPRIDSAGDRYYRGGIAGKRGHGEPLTPHYLRPCRVFGASGSSAFVHREAFFQVGAFPESFGAYFEDVDLAFRLHRVGYHIVYEPEAQVFHHGAASHGKSSRGLLERQSQNEERVFWRNLPWPNLLWAMPTHLAVLAAKASKRWKHGELMPFLCGRLRLLGEVQDLIRHRRWLQELDPSPDLGGWLVENQFWKGSTESLS